MGRRSLLITDVDGTILGNEAGLKQLRAWHQSRRDELDIVYNSGRFVDSILESVRQFDMPQPAAVIGGVGTEIRLFPSGERIDAWPADVAERWDGERLLELLADEPDLELQPAHLLSDWKKSYYLHDADDDRLQALRQKLEAADIQAEIIYSSQRDLDFLPATVNKGSASRWLAQYWAVSSEQVYVSGDSGNDLTLFKQGFRGIVVGNAHPELKALDGDRVYHATGECAAGVLEGLQHWHSAASIPNKTTE